jgi:homocysteine S-methyltransferase
MLEMMYSPDRMIHAFAAARATGLPVWCGLSVRLGDDGRVLSYMQQHDLDFAEIAKLAGESGFDAAGIMHSSPNATGPALDILKRHFDGPLIAYPDSGFFKMPHWQFEEIIAPDRLHAFGCDWIANGARAVGGCCGLSPAHIAALKPLKAASKT